MSKKVLFYGLSFLILFNSCKATKGTESTVRALSTKKVIKAYQKAEFSKNTIQAKIKTRYEDAKNTQSLTIKLRMQKDEVIWMSGTFLGIPVAKVKITPYKVQYYEKLNNTYFDGDFSLISDALGADLDFQQLQNILLGQAVFGLDDGKFRSQIDRQAHLVIPRNQEEILSIFYWINPKHFKLDKQNLESLESDQHLSIIYPEYQKASNALFPKQILINATQSKQTTRLEMEFRNVIFNKKLTFPFSIPSGYTEIKI